MVGGIVHGVESDPQLRVHRSRLSHQVGVLELELCRIAVGIDPQPQVEPRGRPFITVELGQTQLGVTAQERIGISTEGHLAPAGLRRDRDGLELQSIGRQLVHEEFDVALQQFHGNTVPNSPQLDRQMGANTRSRPHRHGCEPIPTSTDAITGSRWRRLWVFPNDSPLCARRCDPLTPHALSGSEGTGPDQVAVRRLGAGPLELHAASAGASKHLG